MPSVSELHLAVLAARDNLDRAKIAHDNMEAARERAFIHSNAMQQHAANALRDLAAHDNALVSTAGAVDAAKDAHRKAQLALAEAQAAEALERVEALRA